MSQELVRQVQKNIANPDTTLKQDVGTALAKGSGVVLAGSAVLGILPFVGVWAFIPVLAFMGLFLGLYLRFLAK